MNPGKLGMWPTALLLALVLFLTELFPGAFLLSPGMDEPIHIHAGNAMLTHGRFVDAENAWWTRPDKLTPPIDALFALFARMGGMPEDSSSAQFIPPGAFRLPRDVSRCFSGGLLLIVFFWSRRLWGTAAGFCSLILLGFHPLFLAHARLIGTDMPAAFGGTLAAWAAWRIWIDSRWGNRRDWRFAAGIALTGAAAGFAVCCKISNIVFLAVPPAAAIYGAWLARVSPGNAWLRRGGAAGAGSVAVALAVCMGAYGWMGLYDSEPVRILGRELLLPFGHEFVACAQWAATMSGETGGTVYYKGYLQDSSIKHFIAAFVYKSPIPWMGLLFIGCGVALHRGWRVKMPGVWFIVALAALLKLAFMTRGIYLGLRSLLVLFPLGCVLAGAVALPRSDYYRAVVVFLFLLSPLALRTWPFFLGYFNVLAKDRIVLVDSDLDWGQGLMALAEWQRKNSPDEPIWLAYFGPSRPEDYGVNYRGLLSPFSPGVRLDPEWEKGRAPAQLGGYVAISATQLAGRYMFEAGHTPDYYSAWLALEPVAKIAGGAIYIYHPGPY